MKITICCFTKNEAKVSIYLESLLHNREASIDAISCSQTVIDPVVFSSITGSLCSGSGTRFKKDWKQWRFFLNDKESACYTYKGLEKRASRTMNGTLVFFINIIRKGGYVYEIGRI